MQVFCPPITRLAATQSLTPWYSKATLAAVWVPAHWIWAILGEVDRASLPVSSATFLATSAFDFIKSDATEQHYVKAGRYATVLLFVLSSSLVFVLQTAQDSFNIILQVGAGTGLLYLLRWYWWRINAWSEISAMATALVVSLGIRSFTPFHGSEPAIFAKQTLVTTVVTTLSWIVVTSLTPPEPHPTLEAFYRRVRPDVFGWKPIAATVPDVPAEHGLGRNLADWIAGCAMIYFALFGVGKLCLLDFRAGVVLLLLLSLIHI